MIIVNLRGGLGNQLFQHATARALSLNSGVPFKIDTSWFDLDVPAHLGYALNHFALETEKATPEEIQQARNAPLLDLSIQNQLGAQADGHTILKPDMGARACVRSTVWMCGYWQSESYFAHAADAVRHDFRFKVPAEIHSRPAFDRITGVNAVSVHFRRGDYSAFPDIGICTPDYYERAVDRIAELAGNIHLFVFSDEPDWVRENFRPRFPTTFVAGHGIAYAYRDMQLMSLCRHHIIANSSFSWWGAWLSTNPDKQVVAPARWFANSPIDLGHVVPAAWHRL